ncbi:MAG: VWA domain-containing protein [Polyangiaceae bacterium]|nr:VWA domain-containing protein [Polyangiaceae bacterium]
MGDPRLEEFGTRIEGLVARPDEVRAPLVRLVKPLLRAIGYKPKLKTEKIAALLEALGSTRSETPAEARFSDTRGTPNSPASRAQTVGSPPRASEIRASALSWDEVEKLHEAAIRELEDNVEGLERTLVVYGRIPLAHAAWVRRLYEVTVRASRAATDQQNEAARRIAAAIDPVCIAAPLVIVPGQTAGAATATPSASSEDADKPTSTEEERLVEVQLLAIDHLLDSARGETEFLARRRKLLEAARKLLLDAAAALPLAQEGVEVRRKHLAAEIARIDRLEAAGLSPHKGLWHQAKEALAFGQRQRLHAALVALDGASLAAGDEKRIGLTRQALEKLGVGDGEPSTPDKLRSLRRSSEEMFGTAAMTAISEGYTRARQSQKRPPKGEKAEEKTYRLLALQWLAPEKEHETHAALCAIDGAVDVGVPLAPMRVTEYETMVRVVRHPTADMILMPAKDIHDIPSAVIDDPRMILLSLAEGRLLARRFVATEVKKRTRTQLVGEARIYVLDGSSSMLEDGKNGSRARVRDAILLGELGTLARRYAEGNRSVRVTLHYRYFTKKIHPVVKVEDGKSAFTAMANVVEKVWRGGTDIENALLSSFETIRKAKDDDPDLARAQIVLVTDGDALVREELITKAREKVGDVPIAVSVVALGMENPALRAIVARQRARGERAFYHFLSDEALVEMCEGKTFSGPSVHVEDDPNEKNLSLEARVAKMRAELGGLVDDLDALAQQRSAASIEAAALDADTRAEQARAEVELGITKEDSVKGEGERAIREAIERDRRGLENRFAKWFPRIKMEPKKATAEGKPIASSDAEATLVVLSTIAEVVGELSGTELGRKADAIELLERLLPDAMLTPSKWFFVLRHEKEIVHAAMESVYAAVEGRGTKGA